MAIKQLTYILRKLFKNQTVVAKSSRNESETESSTATDEGDLTSKNNTLVREQAPKIFVDLKKKGDKHLNHNVRRSQTRQSSGE